MLKSSRTSTNSQSQKRLSKRTKIHLRFKSTIQSSSSLPQLTSNSSPLQLSTRTFNSTPIQFAHPQTQQTSQSTRQVKKLKPIPQKQQEPIVTQKPLPTPHQYESYTGPPLTHWNSDVADAIPSTLLFNSVGLMVNLFPRQNQLSSYAVGTHASYMKYHIDETQLNTDFNHHFAPPLYARHCYSPSASTLWKNSSADVRHLHPSDFIAIFAMARICTPEVILQTELPKNFLTMNPITYTTGWTHASIQSHILPLRMGMRSFPDVFKRQLVHWNYITRSELPLQQSQDTLLINDINSIPTTNNNDNNNTDTSKPITNEQFTHFSIPIEFQSLILTPWYHDMFRLDHFSVTTTISPFQLLIENSYFITIPTIFEPLLHKYSRGEPLRGGDAKPTQKVQELLQSFLSQHKVNDQMKLDLINVCHAIDADPKTALPWVYDYDTQPTTTTATNTTTTATNNNTNDENNKTNTKPKCVTYQFIASYTKSRFGSPKPNPKTLDNIERLQSFTAFLSALPPLDHPVYNNAFQSPPLKTNATKDSNNNNTSSNTSNNNNENDKTNETIQSSIIRAEDQTNNLYSALGPDFIPFLVGPFDHNVKYPGH